VKRLNGYDDQNFHVTVDGNDKDNEYISRINSSGYVFKVVNSLESLQDKDFKCKI